jgi:GT2 family glycosyltransferase
MFVVNVSIIVVTWNASKFVEECFGSIFEEVRELSAEVIAVDNASQDGTAERIAERFPAARLIRLPRNLGFAKANNIAIAAARPGEYIALMNPDARLLPGCLHKLLEYIEANPKIGVLGPKIRNPDGSLQPSCFRAPSVWNAWCRALALDRTVLGRLPLFGGMLMADFHHDRPRDVDALNGCLLLVRREAMEQVGLIDEQFFMYGDDLDWCLRFRKGGWRVTFCPEAEAIHYGGGTSARAPVHCYVEMQKANTQYWRTHYSWPARMMYLASLWVHHATRYFIYSALSVLGKSWHSRVGLKAERSRASIEWLLDSRRTCRDHRLQS